MTREPKDGMEAVALRLYRQLGPRERRVWHAAVQRILDGQSSEDAYSEAFVELGFAPAVARAKVQEALASRDDWRKQLD